MGTSSHQSDIVESGAAQRPITTSALGDALRHVTGRLGTALIALIGVPILTNLMSPEEYGIAAAFRAVATIFVVVMTLNLHVAVGRYQNEGRKDFGQFFTSNIVTVGVLLACFSVLVTNLARPLANVLNLPIWSIYVLPLAALSHVLWLWFEHLSVARNRSQLAMFGALLHSASRLGLSVVLVLFLGGVAGRIWGEVVGILLSAAISLPLLLTFKDFDWHFNGAFRSHLRYAVSYGLPLVPHSLSGIVLASVDQVMIASMRSAKEAGEYAVAYALGSMVYLFAQALQASWSAEFYRAMNAKEFASVRANIDLVYRVAAGGGLVATLALPTVAALVLPQRYESGFGLISLIGFGYLVHFLYQNYAAFFFYTKATGLVATVSVTSGLVNIVANALVVPKYGSVGAAWTTLGSFALMFFMASYLVQFRMGVRIVPSSRLLATTLVAGLIVVATEVCDRWLPSGHPLPLLLRSFFILLSIAYVLPALRQLQRSRRNVYS